MAFSHSLTLAATGSLLQNQSAGARLMTAPLLEARNLTKRFPGVVALKEVTFALAAGEIHALCGENGAGKSTLIKLLSGIHPHGSYEGELRVDGEAVAFDGIRDAEKSGIAVITQEFALVDELSIAENIFLGRPPRRGWRVDWSEMHRRAAALLADFGLALPPELPVGQLGIGQKQLIEIVRAMDKRSRVLVLDEPSAALTEQEVGILLEHLRRLRAQGTACIYISHKLDEVFAIADRITVLRDGASITTLARAATTIPEVIRHMVGRELGDLFPRRASGAAAGAAPEPLLSVRHLEVAPSVKAAAFLRDISFDVRPGEVLGFGGLMGAGRTELLMHLFGAWGHRRQGRSSCAAFRIRAPPRANRSGAGWCWPARIAGGTASCSTSPSGSTFRCPISRAAPEPAVDWICRRSTCGTRPCSIRCA